MRILGNPKNESGYAVMVVTFVLVILSMMGIALLSVVAGGQANRREEVAFTRARYSALAGLEWAKKNIDVGESPDATAKTFSSTNYDVSLNINTFDVTSTGHNDQANVTFTINTQTAANCLNIDTSNSQAAGPNVTTIKAKLNCLTQVVLDRMEVSWTPNSGEKLKQIKFPSSVVFDQNPGVPSGTDIDIVNYTFDRTNTPNCDLKFSGNMGGKTITIIWTFKDKTKITTTFSPA
jgi:Tfp pilus assembly protein PilX